MKGTTAHQLVQNVVRPMYMNVTNVYMTLTAIYMSNTELV